MKIKKLMHLNLKQYQILLDYKDLLFVKRLSNELIKDGGGPLYNRKINIKEIIRNMVI